MEKMKELYGKVAKDSALQAKFEEIMKNAEAAGAEETGKKLTAFAGEAGYEISLDEMGKFFKELSEKDRGQLADYELDMVAGGKSQNGTGNVIGSFITVGIFCAAGSLIFELDRVTGESMLGCKDHFQ